MLKYFLIKLINQHPINPFLCNYNETNYHSNHMLNNFIEYHKVINNNKIIHLLYDCCIKELINRLNYQYNHLIMIQNEIIIKLFIPCILLNIQIVHVAYLLHLAQVLAFYSFFIFIFILHRFLQFPSYHYYFLILIIFLFLFILYAQ